MRGSDGKMVWYDMNVLSDILDRIENGRFTEAEKHVEFDKEIESYLQEKNGEGQSEGSTMHL